MQDCFTVTAELTQFNKGRWENVATFYADGCITMRMIEDWAFEHKDPKKLHRLYVIYPDGIRTASKVF